MSNSAKRDAAAVELAQKRARALRLRIGGLTHEQIKDEMGLGSRARAYELIQGAIADITEEPAQEVRALELQRLDAMVLALWPKAMNGEPSAVDRVLDIMERRAKYLGLDPVVAPSLNVNVNGLAQFISAAFKPAAPDAPRLPPEPIALDVPEPDPAFLDSDDPEVPADVPDVDPDNLQ